MDNLTHTLAGAAFGEAGLKRRTALATPTLLVGANFPDIDVVAVLFGHGLSFRRGWTHGALALVVLPLLLTAVVLAWDRWIRGRGGRIPPGPVRPAQILLLAYLAVVSHPVLDWLNTYGMRWLMPFADTWFYGDALFIVDPWLWLVLAIGTFAARRGERPRVAVLCVLVAGVYAAGMVASGVYGRALVDARMRERGVVPDAVMVGPVPLNPSRRQVVVRDEDLYRTGALHLLPRRRLRLDAEIVRSNRDHPVARAAAMEPEAARFLAWSRFPFFVITPSADGYAVLLDDLRYTDGVAPSWAVVYLEIPSSSVAAVAPQVPRARLSIKPLRSRFRPGGADPGLGGSGNPAAHWPTTALNSMP